MSIPDEELTAMTETLLSAATSAIDCFDARLHAGKEFRQTFMRSLFVVIENAHQGTMRAACQNPDLSANEKGLMNKIGEVSHLYVATILELIISGNALWDDPVLFPAQFKHQMSLLMRSSAVAEIKKAERG